MMQGLKLVTPFSVLSWISRSCSCIREWGPSWPEPPTPQNRFRDPSAACQSARAWSAPVPGYPPARRAWTTTPQTSFTRRDACDATTAEHRSAVDSVPRVAVRACLRPVSPSRVPL